MLPTAYTKIISFSFKVTHRILACNHKLKTWKIENSSKCKYCDEPDDVIEHHLVTCPQTKKFWDTVLNWWKISIGTSFPIDTYNILFGLTNENEDHIINSLNFIFLHGTYYIYCCKQAKSKIDTYLFLVDCKKRLLLMQQLASNEEKSTEAFEKIWGILLNAIWWENW